MIDNRTTELREKLAERGIEYAESQDRFRTRFRFNYCEACGDYLDEIEIMGGCITASKSYLTPEQAIAATLGGGTLTAEQVQKVIYKHGINDGFVYSVLKGSFQAIADELNAELGSDTSAARLAERLRSIADEMRNVGASSMKPHELLAFYAHEVDKVADSLKFAATLGNGTCRNEWAQFGKFRCSECLRRVKPDPLKELLEEFISAYDAWDDWSEVDRKGARDRMFDEYADRFRELLGGDAE